MSVPSVSVYSKTKKVFGSQKDARSPAEIAATNRAKAMRKTSVSKPRKPVVCPRERSWATAYLKHVASVRRLGDIPLRDAMPLLQKLYNVEMPDAPSRAPRSTAAIHLAKEIQRITGIEPPRQI